MKTSTVQSTHSTLATALRLTALSIVAAVWCLRTPTASALTAFPHRLSLRSLEGVPVAAFDTRIDGGASRSGALKFLAGLRKPGARCPRDNSPVHDDAFWEERPSVKAFRPN